MKKAKHKDKAAVCLWAHDDEAWDTGCGDKFCFIVDGPRENGMRFCPYCGRRLRIIHGGQR